MVQISIPRSHDHKRQILRAQHGVLRELIAGMRQLAIEVQAAPAKSAPLAEQLVRLRVNIEVHMLDEEAFLAPILERLDAWGPQRLQLLRTEHAHQRALLEVLCSNLAERTPAELARRALVLATDLLEDMAAEESGLLDPGVLTDDMVSVDQSED